MYPHSLSDSPSGFATDLLHLQTALSGNQHDPMDKNWCFFVFIFPSPPFPLIRLDSKSFFAIFIWTQDKNIAASAGACGAITARRSILANCALSYCNLGADVVGIKDPTDCALLDCSET